MRALTIARDDLRTLDDFTLHYLVCALWASTDDDGNPMDEEYALIDFHPLAIIEARQDCEDFQQGNELVLRLLYRDTHRPYTPEQAGHDFWLTRNGHGAGFWDRGLGDYGAVLTDAADAYGGSDVYVGDDGSLYLS